MEHIEQRMPAAEIERVMKVPEVILKATAGKLKWWEAAEILGVTDRAVRRWRDQLEEQGSDGLYDRRKQRPSPRRVALTAVEQVFTLCQERYFNVRHFHENLRE